jgi:hypothetical protein
MNALSFSIEFDPDDELLALDGPQVWGRGGPRELTDRRPWGNPEDEWGEDVPAWIARVETHRVFRAAFNRPARTFRVVQFDY